MDLDTANRTMTLYVVLLLAIGAYADLDNDDCVLAETESGQVCGARMKASNGDDFVSFLGLPYAKPPLGPLRFAEPQHPDPFVGVFNATVESLMCPQTINEFGQPVDPRMTSEDCLKINVHVPLCAMPEQGVNKPLRKVMVFIHGGSFMAGSGNPTTYGPQFLMTQDIILVTLNYRLHSMGFLSLCSKYVPGNAGLRDAIFALQWVRRNILNFGGDPEEVTLAGQSAGAAVAHLVSISPTTKNSKLMKRLLILSGTAIGNFFTASQPFAQRTAKLFLEGMGISSYETQKEIHKRLTEAPIEELMKAYQYVMNKTSPALAFSPVVECSFLGIEPIIPKDPEILLKEGYGKEYPILFGFTSDEAEVFRNLFQRANIEELMRKTPTLVIPQNLMFTSLFLTHPILISMVKEEYFNQSTPTIDELLVLATDAFYKYPVLRVADIRRKVGAARTCIYEFGYTAVNSSLKVLMKANWTGVGHSEDLTYFFADNLTGKNRSVDELAQPDADSRMKQWMTVYIADYVKAGCPSSPHHNCVSGAKLEMLRIGGPTEQSCGPPYPYLAEKKVFFDKLYSVGRLDILEILL